MEIWNSVVLLRNTYCSRIHWKTLKMTLIGEVGWAAVCWWTQVQKTFSWVGYQNVTPFLDIPRHFLAAKILCREQQQLSKRTIALSSFFPSIVNIVLHPTHRMKTLVQNTIFNGKTWFAISMVQDVSTSLGVLKLRKERNFALQFCLEFDQNLLVHSVKGCSSRFRLFWKENYALLLEEEEQLSKPTSKGLFTCSQVLLTLWEQFNTTTASTAVTRLWGLSSLATKDILKSLWAFFMPKKRPYKNTDLQNSEPPIVFCLLL